MHNGQVSVLPLRILLCDEQFQVYQGPAHGASAFEWLNTAVFQHEQRLDISCTRRSMVSASSPAVAHSAARCINTPSGLAIRRVSITRISAEGKSCAAVE